MDEKPDVSRRDFVKTAAVAVPAIQTVKAANDQVQFGFIGTGSRGQYLIKHINETDRGRCVAVCDVYEPNLKAGAEATRTNPKTFAERCRLRLHSGSAIPAFRLDARRSAGRKARVLRKEPGLQGRRSPRIAE